MSTSVEEMERELAELALCGWSVDVNAERMGELIHLHDAVCYYQGMAVCRLAKYAFAADPGVQVSVTLDGIESNPFTRFMSLAIQRKVSDLCCQ